MTNILIALVVLLTIAALVQLVRVNELLSEITNTDTNAVTDEDNNTNGILFIIIGSGFLAFVVWQMVTWDHLLLPPASSLHGAEIDSLMKVSMTLILVVFFALTPMLFFFAYKYRGKKGNTAYFFAHNNKLEVAWTVIPTIILTTLIIYGLKTWDRAMNPDISESTVIEVYSKQFDWTARYSGLDNTLGESSFLLVEGKNVLGVDMLDENSTDDIVVREVHLPVNKSVLLKFRSRDVIHSAFLPHFRVQMNCVPGLSTQFAFTPTKTTAQMKESEGEDFEYVLLCNKICGSAHFNMQMKFIVESEEDYNKWISSQKTLKNTLTLK
ncbi:cytochrome c oxidase subunit II [Flavobacteriales bacterium]|jgi:cytochrome c oxidase subunit 2|nr:cytochrome c oxidase subunit II [Flavobacteriales bacterium]|tara:strand:- start:765 stop:1739 length:975 start_codon:yes stop_codon:yes gene_type:complete